MTSSQEGQVPAEAWREGGRDDPLHRRVPNVLLRLLHPAARGPICKKPTFDIYQLDGIVFAGSFQLPKGLWGIILIKWAIVLEGMKISACKSRAEDI